MNQSSPTARSRRTALVTGAAQGIGEAVATRLVAEGVRHLVLLDIDERGLERTAAALEKQADGVSVEAVTSDLVDIERSCERIGEALERAGSLDILVNAAGITSRGGLDDITLETFDRLMAINVRAPLFVTQTARPYLGRGAAVVNVTSMLAYGGPPFLLGYSASKAALVALTKGAANTLKRDGIRVFGINLGWTLTDPPSRGSGYVPHTYRLWPVSEHQPQQTELFLAGISTQDKEDYKQIRVDRWKQKKAWRNSVVTHGANVPVSI